MPVGAGINKILRPRAAHVKIPLEALQLARPGFKAQAAINYLHPPFPNTHNSFPVCGSYLSHKTRPPVLARLIHQAPSLLPNTESRQETDNHLGIRLCRMTALQACNWCTGMAAPRHENSTRRNARNL